MRLLQDMKDISYSNAKQSKELSDEIKFIKIEISNKVDDSYNNVQNLNQKYLTLDQTITGNKNNNNIIINQINNDVELLKQSNNDQQQNLNNYYDESSKLLKETSQINQTRLEQFAEQVDI